MTLLKGFIEDFAEAWRAGAEVRTPVWYLLHGHVTVQECLWLERYPENK